MDNRFVAACRAVVFAGVVFMCAEGARAQDLTLNSARDDFSSIVEKSDWMRYDNGKYVGHVYREIRASILPQGAEAGGARMYRGNFFVLEETLRDLRSSARAVNAVVPVQFRVFKNGGMEIAQDRGFPSLRDFPVFSRQAVRPGDKWTAEGERALDPLNEGALVVVPFLAEYEYKGVELYKNIPVHRISARYASRFNVSRARPISYPGSPPPAGVPFSGLSGKHDVDILLRVSDGALLLSRDNLDETFIWPDGKSVRFRGFTLTFEQGIQPLNREALVADISPAVGAIPGVQVEKVDEGVRLTISDLQFKADSDQLLDGEAARLDVVAASLKKIPERTFLVEGHTAAVGSRAGEQELSAARARRIVDELTSRGIGAERFIYKGWGSARPAGDNDTEEGRKMNRRVEITIIE